jgi:hypothetical protein
MKILFSLLLLIGWCGGAIVVAPSQSRPRSIKLAPSTLMDDIRRKLAQEPKLSPAQLAAEANKLLAQEGFDFQFDLCDFVAISNATRQTKRISGGAAQSSVTEYKYLLPLKQTNGQPLILETSTTNEPMEESLCGECFFSVPATRVTRTEIELVAGGRKYLVVRPRKFDLEEMSLVDASMRKVLRTWQVPDQAIPLGISADGRKLYLATAIDDLVLEISDTSSLRLLARDQVSLPPGEYLEKHPRDPGNSYLSFMRFRTGHTSFIIRYSGPCT